MLGEIGGGGKGRAKYARAPGCLGAPHRSCGDIDMTKSKTAQESRNCQDQRACRRMVVGVQRMMPFWVRGYRERGIL